MLFTEIHGDHESSKKDQKGETCITNIAMVGNWDSKIGFFHFNMAYETLAKDCTWDPRNDHNAMLSFVMRAQMALPKRPSFSCSNGIRRCTPREKIPEN